MQKMFYHAGGGADYSCNAGPVTFPIGSTQGALQPAQPEIVTDNIVEDAENFFGDLGDGGDVGVMINASRQLTEVTIVDETVAEFGWQQVAYSFGESDGIVSLSVELINDVVLARALDVEYSCTDGSATGKKLKR